MDSQSMDLNNTMYLNFSQSMDLNNTLYRLRNKHIKIKVKIKKGYHFEFCTDCLIV